MHVFKAIVSAKAGCIGGTYATDAVTETMKGVKSNTICRVPSIARLAFFHPMSRVSV
jgi:hypothetical protein